MPESLKAACIQMNSGPDIARNLEEAGRFIRAAAAKGAQLVCTPEHSSEMRAPKDKVRLALAQDKHPALPFFSGLAKELGIWIQAGSIPVRISEDKIANRAFVFDDKGAITATYDKIHMFDASLFNGENYRESAAAQAGDKAVVTDTPWGKMGLSICYDLRFAYLFRGLAQAGAVMITVPAAFTVPTGKSHWEVLVRARAIETGCFILAAGQTGIHDGTIKTWGHSMIVGPWGEILAEAGTEPGVIMAELDLSEVRKAREALPQLKHDREYSF